jgi:hypothetical protein
MQFSYGTQNTELSVPLFILSQTGTYQEQNLRPFGITVNAATLSKLETVTRGGTNLGISAMQQVANDIIAPQAMPEGAVSIANGWASRRFRFLLKAQESHQLFGGMTTQRIFFGTTDHCDASVNFLPDDMRIYFNSETVVTETLRPGPNGPTKEVMVTGSNQIVSPIEYQHNQNTNLYTNPTAHLVRPEDMFSIGQSQAVVDTLNRTGALPGGVDVILDSRTMVGQGGAYKYSARRDTSPTRYLADAMGAMQHAVMESQMNNFDGVPTSKDHLYQEAQSHATNQDIHSNTFFAALKDHCGFMEKGYVTFGELRRLFPELNRYGDVTHFSLAGTGVRQVNLAEQSNHWNGADNTTIAASLLAQVIPAAMMDNYIRNVSFAATNGNAPGQFAIEIHEKATRSVIDGINMIPYLNAFLHRLRVDVLGVISHNNQVPFNVSMMSDLAGDSVIDIRIGAESVIRYVAPTCCDSLFSPVLTRRDDLPRQMSADLLYLVEQAVPNQQPTQIITSMNSGLYNAQAIPAAHQTVQPSGAFNVEDFGLL